MGKQIEGTGGVTEVQGTALEELTEGTMVSGETQRGTHLMWKMNKVNKRRLEQPQERRIPWTGMVE